MAAGKTVLAQQQLCLPVNATPSAPSHTIANSDAFVGDRCFYTNFAMSLNTTKGNTSAASVDIAGGTVSAGTLNGILFKGFTVASQDFADLGNRGPLRIAVRGVTFLDGALLKFERLFPMDRHYC